MASDNNGDTVDENTRGFRRVNDGTSLVASDVMLAMDVVVVNHNEILLVPVVQLSQGCYDARLLSRIYEVAFGVLFSSKLLRHLK